MTRALPALFAGVLFVGSASALTLSAWTASGQTPSPQAPATQPPRGQTPPAGRGGGRGAAQMPSDPVAGNWRGMLKSPQGDSAIIVSIVKKTDGYSGSTTGLSEGGDVALEKLTVTGNQLSLAASADSRLGAVQIAAEMTADGNAMRGAGTLAIGSQKFPVTFELQRRARQDVVQHQVEQRADYFNGTWKFEYIGGEFPPLSTGGRSGTVTFAPAKSNFVNGRVQGDLGGKPYQETLAIGVDPEAKTVVYHERRSDGVELVSLGSWRSPLAIVFQTSPVQANGKTYQLRRVMQILSESSFDVTEEFSVDGGPFRRLGSAHYTKQ